MPPEVFTCAEFVARLPTVLQAHPTATVLLLQLSPVTPPKDSKQKTQRSSVTSTQPTTRVNCVNESFDFVTIYAVLLKRLSDAEGGDLSRLFANPTWTVQDGDANVEGVCLVIGHASHITLKWCAQVQHTLSVSVLLASATETHNCNVKFSGNSFSTLFSESQDETDQAAPITSLCGYASSGLHAFVVRLSPFVPPLQWDRHVDGLFGSQHFVCASHRCYYPLNSQTKDSITEKTEGRVENVRSGAAWCIREASRGDGAAATHAEAPSRKVFLQERDAPPPQRAKLEASSDSTPQKRCPLPFRVAAVLNGSAPLPRRPLPQPSICVLFLVACDGYALTAQRPDAGTSSSLTLLGQASHPAASAFDFLCDLIGDAILPEVSLDVVNGTWARSGGVSGALMRDVCGVRGRLGESCAIQLPANGVLSTNAEQRVRSITFVLDVSTSLLDVLMGAKTPALEAADVSSTKPQDSLTAQIAGAVQDVLGQLVAANIDVFTFCPLNKGNQVGDRDTLDPRVGSTDKLSNEDGLPAKQPAGASALLTSEMLCRSIAESVSQIVALSTHSEFKFEVARLLWDGDAADPSAAARALPSSAAIQRRIEERLLKLVSE